MTIKQERDRQRRRWEKHQANLAREAEQKAKLRRVLTVVATLLGVAALVAVLVTSLSSKDDTTQAAPTGSQSPSAEATGLTKAGCPQPPKSPGTTARLELPDAKPVAGKTYEAVLTTNCGDIVATLDGAKAPQAVASFKQLAETDYWLNSACHRLTTVESLRVLQCGDPTGTGQGTPGYGFQVENPPADGKYPRGTIAMARTNDPLKGNGGQFFIVYGDSQLPTDGGGYTIFGTVTSGLDIVDKIAAAGIAGSSPQDGAPAAPISILRVALTEKKA